MSRARTVAIFACVVFSLAPWNAEAQTVVCGDTLDPQASLGWKSAKAAAPNGSLDTAVGILLARYDRAVATWPEVVATPARSALVALAEGRNPAASFSITKSGTDPLALKQGVFHGESYFIELPIDAASPLCADSGVKRARVEFATIAQGVFDASGELLVSEVRRLADQVVTLEATYDKYLFDGFPMFPWEAAVNSWFLTDKRIANGPPRSQLVFLHPAAGLVASTAKDAKSDTGATLSIEPLGWVRYTKDYRHWMGVSLLAVFPGDRDPGYGVVFNYDMFKLGVTWHDDKTGEHDGAAVFVGVDLYKFLGDKYRDYDGYRDRVKEIKAAITR